jgi:hypothetical protein
MYILYYGVGAKVDNIHTKKEFMDIMRSTYTDGVWDVYISEIDRVVFYSVDYKGWTLPGDFVLFSFSDWIEYADATIIE